MLLKFKRWLPFILLIFLVLVLSGYMVLSQQTSDYKPITDEPARIFREACSGCHGENGQGKGLYPDLLGEQFKSDEIRDLIVNGSFLMPAYKHIKSDTLDSLIEYVNTDGFKK